MGIVTISKFGNLKGIILINQNKTINQAKNEFETKFMLPNSHHSAQLHKYVQSP